MTVHRALVEAEAVFLGGCSPMCVCLLCAYGFGRIPRVIHIWQWLHQLGMKMVAATFCNFGGSQVVCLSIGKSLGGSIGTWSPCDIPCPHSLSVYGVSSEFESSTFPSPMGHYYCLSGKQVVVFLKCFTGRSQLVVHYLDAARIGLVSDMCGASMFMGYFTTLDNAWPSLGDV